MTENERLTAAEAREAYLAAYGPDDGSTEPVRFEVQARHRATLEAAGLEVVAVRKGTRTTFGGNRAQARAARDALKAQLADAEGRGNKWSIVAAIRSINKALSRPVRASEPEPGAPPEAPVAVELRDWHRTICMGAGMIESKGPHNYLRIFSGSRAQAMAARDALALALDVAGSGGRKRSIAIAVRVLTEALATPVAEGESRAEVEVAVVEAEQREAAARAAVADAEDDLRAARSAHGEACMAYEAALDALRALD